MGEEAALVFLGHHVRAQAVKPFLDLAVFSDRVAKNKLLVSVRKRAFSSWPPQVAVVDSVVNRPWHAVFAAGARQHAVAGPRWRDHLHGWAVFAKRSAV
jgi:hypothetical protein